jgi:tetratricopeptide (TPR) repeat protein
VYGLFVRNDPDALPLAKAAVAMHRAFETSPDFDPVNLAIGLLICGHCLEDASEQKSYYEEAVALVRAARGDAWLPEALANVGGAYFETGDWERAVASFQESMTRYRERGDTFGLAWSQTFFANILRKHDDEPAAIAHYHSALPVLADIGTIGSSWAIAVTLEGLAAIAAATSPERAAWLFGAAARLRAADGATTEPEWWGHTPDLIDELRARLGDGAYNAAFAAGAQGPLAEVVAAGLSVNPADG